MRHPILTATLLALTAFSCSREHETIYLSDFIKNSEEEAGMAIRQAMDKCREIGASRLVLPGGTLRISRKYLPEKYIAISNNDSGIKRVAFDLTGMDNFSIIGNGTELLFSGFISPFIIDSCHNVVIQDISIDFTRTFHSEGTVEGSGDGWLDIRFPEDYICEITDGNLYFRDAEGIYYPFSNLLEFDSLKKEPAFHRNDFGVHRMTLPAESLGENKYRIHRKGLKADTGNIIVFGAAYRKNPAFTVNCSENVKFNRINLYHCGGMGFICQMSGNIDIDSCNVIPAPGKDRIVSITADATHFSNCYGSIRITGCTFMNQKDDATNIHGLYMAVDSIIDSHTAIVAWRHPQQQGLEFLKPGMTVELVNNRNMDIYAHRTVAKAEPLNRTMTLISFKEKLPDSIRVNHVIASDVQNTADVLISGCTFRGNRARGLLIGSRGKVIIENNFFHIAGASILFEGDGNYWFEQSGVRDVTIRGNIFENCNYGSQGWGDACIAVGSWIPEHSGCRYHRNIRVQGNTFYVFDKRIASLYCVNGFTFTADNIIEHTDDYPDTSPLDTESFSWKDCDNISIEKHYCPLKL